jgi:hypothetical protein
MTFSKDWSYTWQVEGFSQNAAAVLAKLLRLTLLSFDASNSLIPFVYLYPSYK